MIYLTAHGPLILKHMPKIISDWKLKKVHPAVVHEILNQWTSFPRPSINLQAPCIFYIGQAFRYTPENAFYIFNQQIYSII